MMGEKAASEVTGALLVIVVMLSAAGLIYLMSYPTVTHGIESLKYRNAVKNLVELREVVERVRVGIEDATLTMNLGGGSIAVEKDMKVTVDGKLYELGSIVVKVGSKVVALQTGIFERDNPISISDPIVVKTSDTIYITFYNFTGNFSAGGDKIMLHLSYVNLTKPDNRDDHTQVDIETEYCENWKKYFSEVGLSFADSDCSDDKISIVSASSNISVRIYTMEVS